MFRRPLHWIGLFAAALVCVFVAVSPVRAAEVMPPPPKAYFNDYARITRGDTARRLNASLQEFERATSNQIVVAVFPKMESDSSIEDYTVRIAQSWHVGQKGRSNGAVLFVFVQDRKMYIQVGYGLEGALTDYICHQIIQNEIKPRFRAGDYDGGLSAGIQAMMAATRGEYKGTGKTVAERKNGASDMAPFPLLLMFALFLYFVIFAVVKGLGRMGGSSGPIIMGGGGGNHWHSGGDGGGGGGFSSGGDGGGFSGGGGSFGGGGAGGNW